MLHLRSRLHCRLSTQHPIRPARSKAPASGRTPYASRCSRATSLAAACGVRPLASALLGRVHPPFRQRFPTGGQNFPIGGWRSPMGNRRPPMGFSRSPMGERRSPKGILRSPMGFLRSPMGERRLPNGFRRSPDGFLRWHRLCYAVHQFRALLVSGGREVN